MNDNASRPTAKGQSLWEAALGYARRGWSIIPIARRQKKADIKWKPFQTCRASDQTLGEWFIDGKYDSCAVILGTVSGGLACRDFDTMTSYERWAAAHPDLARELPTVATKRGRHVYFTTDDLRYVEMDDGEYRADSRHYCLLPPSRHPEGHVYSWAIPLPDGPLPIVNDVSAAGLLGGPPCETETAQIAEETEDNRRTHKTTEAMCKGEACSRTPLHCAPTLPNHGSVASVVSVTAKDTERVIQESLPSHKGQRHRQVFELARTLKAIPWLADADPNSLRAHVRKWHRLGVEQGVIGTEPFEESWIDFLRAWPRVKFPKGTEPMAAILERARCAIPPCADEYEDRKLRLLVAVCRELQRNAGEHPFFLAARTGARLLGLDRNHVKVWRWLFLLQQDKVILEIEKGDHAKRRASRYRYLRE